MFELDLGFIERDAIWFNGDVLIVVLGVRLVQLVDRSSASFDTKPLTEVSTLGQRGGSSMGSARQLGVRVRSLFKNSTSKGSVMST